MERVSHQPGHQINEEVERATMAGMLDLRDVFELVIDGLDDRAFPQQQLVKQRQQLVFHILTQLGDELHAPLP